MGKNRLQLQMNNWFPLIIACVAVSCSDGNAERLVLPELSQIIVVEKDTKKTITAIRETGDINVRDELGGTPLMYAAGLHINDSLRDTHKDSGSENIDVIKALVEKGANVNAARKDGQATVLTILVFHGRIQAIRYLLAHGANPNLATKGGTPLMLASYRCYPDIVETLLKAGADRASKDSAGQTALDRAKAQNCAAAVSLLISPNGS